MPVYLHKDNKGSRALLLTTNAASFDPVTYNTFTNYGIRFCLSPISTIITPAALWVYRKTLPSGAVDHVYTTKPQAMGTSEPGQVGRQGYKCMGVMGFVRGEECAEGTAAGLVEVHRWWSGQTGLHVYSRDRQLGARLGDDYKYEGIMGYTLPCHLF